MCRETDQSFVAVTNLGEVCAHPAQYSTANGFNMLKRVVHEKQKVILWKLIIQLNKGKSRYAMLLSKQNVHPAVIYSIQRNFKIEQLKELDRKMINVGIIVTNSCRTKSIFSNI